MQHSEQPDWHRLDNLAKIFPSIETHRVTNIFRISATLKEKVSRGLLQDALETILPRFPYYQVRLEYGLFWYSLAKNQHPPQVHLDGTYPCMPFQKKLNSPHPFRVRYFQNRVAVEFHHYLTDGTGALIFFKSLLAEYLSLKGVEVQDWMDIIRPHSPMSTDETEDAFSRVYVPKIPHPVKGQKAFHLPFRLVPQGVYHVTTGVLSVQAVKAISKQNQVSLTEFLTAVFFAAFQDYIFQIPPALRKRHIKPLTITIPVNLRKIFPSKTMRNFFVLVPLTMDPRLGRYEWDEILQKVHHFLQTEVDERLIKQQIARNMDGERHPVVRLFPLFMKDMLLKFLYLEGEQFHTSSLSNLGAITLPPEMAREIQRFDFIPPPSPYTKVSASVVSLGDALSISFGSQAYETEIERLFFTRLRKLGIPVKIESNF